MFFMLTKEIDCYIVVITKRGEKVQKVHFVPLISLDVSPTDEQFEAVQNKKICSQCLGEIDNYNDEYSFISHYGFYVFINEQSGVCKKCFEKMKEKYHDEPYKENRFRELRACGSEELTMWEEA